MYEHVCFEEVESAWGVSAGGSLATELKSNSDYQHRIDFERPFSRFRYFLWLVWFKYDICGIALCTFDVLWFTLFLRKSLEGGRGLFWVSQLVFMKYDRGWRGREAGSHNSTNNMKSKYQQAQQCTNEIQHAGRSICHHFATNHIIRYINNNTKSGSLFVCLFILEGGYFCWEKGFLSIKSKRGCTHG